MTKEKIGKHQVLGASFAGWEPLKTYRYLCPAGGDPVDRYGCAAITPLSPVLRCSDCGGTEFEGTKLTGILQCKTCGAFEGLTNET